VAGGVVVYSRAEAQTIDTSRMEMTQIRLDAVQMAGMVPVTNELIEDSPQTIVDIVRNGFQRAAANKRLQMLLRGTGVNEFLGVLNSPALVSVSAEAAQDSGEILYDNVVAMKAACYGDKANKVWLANWDLEAPMQKLVFTIGDSGAPVYNPSTGAEPDQLFGMPVIYTDVASALGTSGDLLLCDWSQYLHGVYGSMREAASIHVRFSEAETMFRFIWREGGAPAWDDSITPQNGSTTKSPFVALATRS
jgi:HK97 family phage major capsid protein